MVKRTFKARPRRTHAKNVDHGRTNLPAQSSQVRGLKILAIDPGITGAMAVFNELGSLVEWFRMPTIWRKVGKRKRRSIDCVALYETLLAVDVGIGINIAVMEDVNPFGQGVTSAFAFGRSVGMVQGVLATLGLEAAGITPQRWKKHFGLIKTEKLASIARAQRIFKQLGHLRHSALDSGIADAALIGQCFITTCTGLES